MASSATFLYTLDLAVASEEFLTFLTFLASVIAFSYGVGTFGLQAQSESSSSFGYARWFGSTSENEVIDERLSRS